MPKREALGNKTELKGTNNSYTIIEEIGRGASCIAYKGRTTGGNVENDVIIKELFPRMYGIKRNGNNGSLCADGQKEDSFEAAKERFLAAVDLQSDLRGNDPTQNSTFEVRDCFEANNTIYAVTEKNSGISLEKKLEDEEFGVLEILKAIKSITILIGKYHEQGYLYMDIKPQNVFIFPETNELVKLYDFDTVVSLDKINDSGFYSYTEGFAAPEVKSGDAIDVRSDLYSIGAALYYCIFGKTPDIFENHPNASFCFDQPLFERKNPSLKAVLEEILRKTLCGIPDRRYKNAKELEDALNKAIEKAEANAFLLSQELRPISCNYIKRAKLMEEIKGLFQNTNAAFLYGLGGIGKSEAAKEYARTFSKHYRHVQMQEYCQSLEETVARLEFSGVDEIADTKKMCENKLKLLRETPDDELTLIIIDNYNPTEMPKSDVEFINKSLAGIKNVHFLFTGWFRRGERSLEIKPLDEKDLMDLFFSYYTLDNDEARKQCRRLIRLTSGHTLTIELVARLAEEKRNQGGKTLTELVDAIEKTSEGIESIDSRVGKNNTREKVNKMIAELFDLLALKENEKNIMRHAALLPSEGIEGKIFSGLLRFETYDDFLDEAVKLLNLGWLRIRKENRRYYILVHPVVADVAVAELKPTVENCKDFINRFSQFTRENEYIYNQKNWSGKLNQSFLSRYRTLKERMDLVLVDNDIYNSEIRIAMMHIWKIIDISCYRVLLDRDYYAYDIRILLYLINTASYEEYSQNKWKFSRKRELLTKLRHIIPIMFDKYSFIDASDLESVFQQFLNECRGNDQYIHEMREYAVLVLDSVSGFFNSKEDYSLYPNWRFDRILFMLLFIAGILQISDGFTKTPRIKKQIYAIFEICSSVFCETPKKNTRRDKRIYYAMDEIITLLNNHVRSERLFEIAEKKMLLEDYSEVLLLLCDICSDTGRSKEDVKILQSYKMAEYCAEKVTDITPILFRYDNDFLYIKDFRMKRIVKRIIRKNVNFFRYIFFLLTPF